MKCVVMRHPVFMEDEGRSFFVGLFDSREEAEKWVAAQADEFYKPSDYFICEAPGGKSGVPNT